MINKKLNSLQKIADFARKPKVEKNTGICKVWVRNIIKIFSLYSEIDTDIIILLLMKMIIHYFIKIINCQIFELFMSISPFYLQLSKSRSQLRS